MRTLTDHIVEGDTANHQLTIEVQDEVGQCMRVQLPDRECSIEFAYDIQVASVHGVAVTRSVTYCYLRDLSVPRRANDDAVILAEAAVVRYYKDPPNRELARKAALTKALRGFDITLNDWSSAQAKDRRKLFWAAYLGRKKAAMQSRAHPEPKTKTA